MTPKPPADVADALIGAAPLAARWIQRLLAATDPPLTVAEYLALRAIAAGPLAGADLAQRTGVSGAAVSQLLAELEDKGLVARSPVPGDRRRLEVTLSRRGRGALERASALLRERIAGLLVDLKPHESRGLAEGLDRIESMLAGTPPPRRPPPPKHPPPHRR
jgi:DNA-binding MarR family transcriptional regulator